MPAFLSSDAAKVLLLAGAFVAIYRLSRWASDANRTSPGVGLPPQPEAPSSVKAAQPWSNVVTIDRRPEFHSAQPVNEDELLPIHIVQMYFSKFDFDPGPPDPKRFADELFVKLYDENSGNRWTQSYFVATPQGLEEMLERENWDYAYTEQIFFVRRYDAKIVRQAVVEQLISTQEKPSPPREPEDRYV